MARAGAPAPSRDATAGKAPRSQVARIDPYEKIKQAILSGELGSGRPLVEQTLAEWCGVSRTPVREALRRLEQDGLIDRTIHGLAVRERSPEEILDLYDTRIVLESATARAAAARRTEHDLREMRWALQRAGEVEEGDREAMMRTNQQFHRALWHSSHNESLIDLLERLHLHLARYPGTTLGRDGRWLRSLEEHSELVDAIEERDGDKAHRIAQQHFLEARDIRLELFAAESGRVQAP
jgi:DNA-binding GntR family transcriptional regulator